MLTRNASLWILDHLQPDFILNGHDHVGCDVTHLQTLDGSTGQLNWTASDTEDAVGQQQHSRSSSEPLTVERSVREVTQRSMMAEYGGYSGLFEVRVDRSLQGPRGVPIATEETMEALGSAESAHGPALAFHYTPCAFYNDVSVWTVLVLDCIAVGLWAIYGLYWLIVRLQRQTTRLEEKQKLQ
ncbi:hypothetical protein BGW38_007627 [Lunasporangiospora selenospora]|uniref:Calcineurin-like phosphoesterase n=1 Tax=Lunasporangiospora selenospora TaxID=979761 RepID=A0A9P6FLI7_9FUNG|nr:hypothetical protein BGW38_007627 [Lunasporangiospora selenospora]